MKKKVLLLVGLMLCLLLVGCGKDKESIVKPISIVPDPNDYFSGAEITLLQNDDSGFYYMVKKFKEEDFDKYVDACKSGIFTDVDYSTINDTKKIYYIYDSEKKYRLELTMNTESGIVNLICYVVNKQ